jgi:hypothetical protein
VDRATGIPPAERYQGSRQSASGAILMITPPDLRRQARHLLTQADRAAHGIEKRILLDLAAKLGEPRCRAWSLL